MPSKYVRKSSRATTYSREDLETAIRRVRNKELTNYAASQIYGIPTSTLNDRVRQRTGVFSQSLGRPPVIEIELEARLANCLRVLEKWGWGLSKEELLDIVAAFIKTNGIKTPFKNGLPGNDWFVAFRKRHNLSVKKPQPVEYLRKRMTDPFVIDAYFTILAEELTRLNLHDQPHKICNLDETSVSLDPTKTKVVGGTGLPCTRTTAGTGKENITVLTTVNAAGKKLDPLIVFKGKNVYEQWMAEQNNNYDFELAYAASKRGWMERDIFFNYMKNIVIPNLGDERPVLIIYDGHVTHVDEKVVNLAIEHSLTILKLPAHTSHLLQPLDLVVFKSFKSIWDKQLVRWQRENIGSKVRKQVFADMFAKAWHETNPEVIRNGFKKGGIHPLNSKVIPKEKFDPSAYKRWQLELKKRTLRQPKTLGQLCREKINEQMFDNLSTQPQTEKCIENNTTSKTFEDLLLETLKSNNSNNKTTKKLKKVASGADVITRTFLENQITQEVENKSGQATSRMSKKNQEKRRNVQEEKTSDIIFESNLVHTKRTDVKYKQPDTEKEQGKGPKNMQVQGKEQKKIKVTEKEQIYKLGQDGVLDNEKVKLSKKPLKKKGKATKYSLAKQQPKAKICRRFPSEDSTSVSISEMSFHDDSDEDTFSDILINSDAAELDDIMDISNDEILPQAKLSREEEIEKIVNEIRSIEEIPTDQAENEKSTKIHEIGEKVMGQAEDEKTTVSITTIKREKCKSIKEKPITKPKEIKEDPLEKPCSSQQAQKKVIVLESIPITSKTNKMKINRES